jgi:hypothetical protein
MLIKEKRNENRSSFQDIPHRLLRMVGIALAVDMVVDHLGSDWHQVSRMGISGRLEVRATWSFLEDTDELCSGGIASDLALNVLYQNISDLWVDNKQISCFVVDLMEVTDLLMVIYVAALRCTSYSCSVFVQLYDKSTCLATVNVRIGFHVGADDGFRKRSRVRDLLGVIF